MSKASPEVALRPDMTLAEAVAEVLKHEGIPYLSAYPTTPMINAAAAQGIRPVLCRQERIGVHIADGWSRTTAGRPPGVFAMQYGPGVENAYAGMATAFADSVPMLFLPLGYAEDKQDATRFHNADRVRPISKSVERVRSPKRVGDVLRRAFSAMRTGRPGPVVVELPINLAGKPIGEGAVPYRSPATASIAGDPEAVERAAALLAGAERPVILAGQGVLYSEGASAALVELAELLDAPVGTTLEGKGAFPEDHPLALGTGGMSMPEPLRDTLRDADVVLAVGTSLTRHLMVITPPTGKTLIHVTIDPADLNKDVPADAAVIGDARLVMGQLLEVLRERFDEPVVRGSVATVKERKDAWLASWAPQLTSDERPINHYRVVGALRNVLDPARSVLTHDSGSPRDQVIPFYETTVPHGYLSWGKSHALGTGLGLIMGAKLAAPEKFCVNLMGDAAFGMVGLDFETAVRNRIPITTIVLNNGTMAIETEALDVAHERFGIRDIGGNYADLARAMGGTAFRVEDPAELEPTLEKARQTNADGDTVLIEVITSPALTPFSARFGR